MDIDDKINRFLFLGVMILVIVVMILSYIVFMQRRTIHYNTESINNDTPYIQDEIEQKHTKQDDCIVKINEMCISKVFQPKQDDLACAKAKALGKVKDCYFLDDRFASAIKACADQGKRLPNAEELKELGKYLYSNKQVKDTVDHAIDITGNLDISTLRLLGIYDDAFDCWEDKEVDAQYAYFRSFENPYSARGHANRYVKKVYAFCVQ